MEYFSPLLLHISTSLVFYFLGKPLIIYEKNPHPLKAVTNSLSITASMCGSLYFYKKFINNEPFTIFGIFLACAIIEIMQYIFHKTMHEKKISYHKVHHQIVNPYSLACFYNSPKEVSITGFSITLFFIIFQIPYYSVLISSLLSMFFNCYIHTYDEKHLAHHSRGLKHYSQPFTHIMDDLFTKN